MVGPWSLKLSYKSYFSTPEHWLSNASEHVQAAITHETCPGHKNKIEEYKILLYTMPDHSHIRIYSILSGLAFQGFLTDHPGDAKDWSWAFLVHIFWQTMSPRTSLFLPLPNKIYLGSNFSSNKAKGITNCSRSSMPQTFAEWHLNHLVLPINNKQIQEFRDYAVYWWMKESGTQGKMQVLPAVTKLFVTESFCVSTTGCIEKPSWFGINYHNPPC